MSLCLLAQTKITSLGYYTLVVSSDAQHTALTLTCEVYLDLSVLIGKVQWSVFIV